MERILAVRDEVLRALTPLGPEESAVGLAAGRILARDAVAEVASPPCSCSAMDGFALRAEEVHGGATVRVVGTLFAGDAATKAGAVGQGETIRIFTGAPMPPGADAVVMQERVSVEGALARIQGPVARGENVRQEGEDLVKGAVALAAGGRIGPRQLALLTAVGVERVFVGRRPRVTVISSGEEIVGGRVPDSNGPAVAGVLRFAGAEVERRAV